NDRCYPRRQYLGGIEGCASARPRSGSSRRSSPPPRALASPPRSTSRRKRSRSTETTARSGLLRRPWTRRVSPLNRRRQPGTRTWSGSGDVVEAEASGRVVAKKAGKAMVTASYENVSAQVPVEVVDVATIDITPPAISLTGPAGTTLPMTYAVKDSHQKVLDL